ncbi:MAG TPA: exosortase H [Blastocatellia bacterium]|nr:exosortase H [Blastocatellia bacterium]
MLPSERVIEFLTANRKPLRFLALFVLIFAACYLLFGVTPGIRLGVIKPYTEFLANAVAAIINVFGAGATTNGALVSSPRYSIDIAMGCDGVEASCLYLAGVLAFPTSWRARLIGVAFGVPLIHAINLARLVGLYYVGIYLPSVADEVHVYVAQTIVILLSTAILIFWLERFGVRHQRA